MTPSEERQACRDMVDAIRESLGMAPLYRQDEAPAFSFGEFGEDDGNRRVSAYNTQHFVVPYDASCHAEAFGSLAGSLSQQITRQAERVTTAARLEQLDGGARR